MSAWLGIRGQSQHPPLRESDHNHPGLDFVTGDSEMGVLKQDCIDTGSWEGRTSSPLSLSGPPLAPPRPESDLMDTKFPLAAPDACGPAPHYLDQHRNNLLLPLPTKTEIETSETGSEGGEPPLCAGCRIRITDKYYLCAVEKKWHASCLKCAECGAELENEASCFEKDGQIYCREDYQRMFGSHSRMCARCHGDITCNDLVMKARHCVFHVECFKCAQCDTSLRKGDLFGMFDDVLYCKLHFEMMTSYPGPVEHMDMCPPLHSPVGELYPGGMSGHGPHPGMFVPGPGHPPGFPGPEHWPYPPGPDFGPIPDYQFNNNNDPIKKRRGRKKRKVDEFAAINGYMEGYPPGMEGHGVGQSKTKRARTSFKHHQLRIMKAHFQVNQNPDSRELKMLSQKTGLDKKVLQVWFQNARAKWRRMNANGGATIDNVLGPDDEMKGDDLGSDMSPGPGDCGPNSMISCC